MRLALLGYGSVGRAFARLVEQQASSVRFRITGIHTARHGTAMSEAGLALNPRFGPPVASTEEFLDRVVADAVLELTPLIPSNGEPAISHIRAAFERGMHVVTANKGPIAHAYSSLVAAAARAGVAFRFESTVMDGTPVFSLVRNTLPGANVSGFTGVLNSTSGVVIAAMEKGQTIEEGIAAAQRMGICEVDASLDINGWDSAVKTAALANVLMDAQTTPLSVDTRGIGRLTPPRIAELGRKGKTVRLVSRVRRTPSGIHLRVRAEVVDQTDRIAVVQGASNVLFLHTDLMGTIGIMSINPGVEQTAYGLFSDLLEIARQA